MIAGNVVLGSSQPTGETNTSIHRGQHAGPFSVEGRLGATDFG